tara:strand:- start:47 stop:355 length:309 start_codon:yes stop_codon:yes gene_type:complete
MKKKYKRRKSKPIKIESRENEHKDNFFKALNFINYLFYFIGCLIVIIIGYWKDIDWNGFTIALIPFEGLIVYGIIGGIVDFLTDNRYGFLLGGKTHNPLDID